MATNAINGDGAIGRCQRRILVTIIAATFFLALTNYTPVVQGIQCIRGSHFVGDERGYIEDQPCEGDTCIVYTCNFGDRISFARFQDCAPAGVNDSCREVIPEKCRKATPKEDLGRGRVTRVSRCYMCNDKDKCNLMSLIGVGEVDEMLTTKKHHASRAKPIGTPPVVEIAKTRKPKMPQTDKPKQPGQTNEPKQPEQTDEPKQPDQTDEPGKPDQTDEPEDTDQTDEPKQPEQTDEPGKPDQTDEPKQPDQTDEPGKPDQTDEPENTDQTDEPEKPDQTDNVASNKTDEPIETETAKPSVNPFKNQTVDANGDDSAPTTDRPISNQTPIPTAKTIENQTIDANGDDSAPTTDQPISNQTVAAQSTKVIRNQTIDANGDDSAPTTDQPISNQTVTPARKHSTNGSRKHIARTKTTIGKRTTATVFVREAKTDSADHQQTGKKMETTISSSDQATASEQSENATASNLSDKNDTTTTASPQAITDDILSHSTTVKKLFGFKFEP